MAFLYRLTFNCAKLNISLKGRDMSGTQSSDPSASEAIELEAVISSVREEEPEVTETESQANDESQDDNSKKDVKPKSNTFLKQSN